MTNPPTVVPVPRALAERIRAHLHRSRLPIPAVSAEEHRQQALELQEELLLLLCPPPLTREEEFAEACARR